MGGGRQKGSKAERELAKLLEGWWRELEPEAVFVRTPLSGGWGGPTQRAGFRASGDVMTTSDTFPFTVEGKRREGWNVDWFLLGRRSPVWKWWVQAEGQAEEQGGHSLLWVRKNGMHWHVIMRYETARVLKLSSRGPVVYGPGHTVVYLLGQHLLEMDPKQVIKCLR